MLKTRIRSFKFAFKGLRNLFSTQPNARIHLLSTLVVILVGFLLHITLVEWALVAVAVALVITAEAFNTALEYLTDLVSPDYHPVAGKVKDVAAAGVLIAALAAVVIGICIFGPKLLALVPE
jgi:diacylglycerol kinase (ATP)